WTRGTGCAARLEVPARYRPHLLVRHPRRIPAHPECLPHLSSVVPEHSKVRGIQPSTNATVPGLGLRSPATRLTRDQSDRDAAHGTGGFLLRCSSLER